MNEQWECSTCGQGIGILGEPVRLRLIRALLKDEERALLDEWASALESWNQPSDKAAAATLRNLLGENER